MTRIARMLLAFSLFVGCLGAVPAVSTAAPGGATDSFAQVMVRMILAVRVMACQGDWGLDGGGTCLVGAQLPAGKTYDLDRRFEAGVTYLLVTAGDDAAEAVNLEIRDNGRRLVAATADEPVANFEFTPPRSGYYRIRMTLRRSRDLSFCSFVVLRRGGWNVPLANLIEAGDQFLLRCRIVATAAGQKGLNASFVPGEGCVWGVVMRGGEARTISNINLGDRRSVAIAAGDTQVQDLDLFVVDDQDRVLESDTDGDDYPFVEFQPDSGRRYGVRVQNAAASDAGVFTLFGVVQIH